MWALVLSRERSNRSGNGNSSFAPTKRHGWTGRAEWAGEAGWWNVRDRDAAVEAEASRFGARSREIAEQARAGRLRSARVMGRQITVCPKAGEPFEAYAAGLADPASPTSWRSHRYQPS